MLLMLQSQTGSSRSYEHEAAHLQKLLSRSNMESGGMVVNIHTFALSEVVFIFKELWVDGFFGEHFLSELGTTAQFFSSSFMLYKFV